MSTQYDQTTTPDTTTAPAAEGRQPAANEPATPARPRGWRRLLLRGRSAVAAGILAGVLAIGSLGFGAGYAVADRNADQNADQGNTTRQTPAFDRGDGRSGEPGEMGPPPSGLFGGPMDGQTDGGTGSSGQAPDFDGDGRPDDTSPDTTEDSAQDST
jgi:hypothetical protein